MFLFVTSGYFFYAFPGIARTIPIIPQPWLIKKFMFPFSLQLDICNISKCSIPGADNLAVKLYQLNCVRQMSNFESHNQNILSISKDIK